MYLSNFHKFLTLSMCTNQPKTNIMAVNDNQLKLTIHDVQTIFLEMHKKILMRGLKVTRVVPEKSIINFFGLVRNPMKDPPQADQTAAVNVFLVVPVERDTKPGFKILIPLSIRIPVYIVGIPYVVIYVIREPCYGMFEGVEGCWEGRRLAVVNDRTHQRNVETRDSHLMGGVGPFYTEVCCYNTKRDLVMYFFTITRH